MARVLTVSLAMVLASGVATLRVPAAQAHKQAAVSQSSPYYDVAAESVLYGRQVNRNARSISVAAIAVESARDTPIISSDRHTWS